MKIFIVVAAHNVEKSIGKAIADLKKHRYNNIVVVDDGSTDSSGKIAYEKGATVLTHSLNRGQGAALRTGNEYALQHGADIIVHFDGDGQMMAEDIPEMINPILKKEADITIGSRFLGKDPVNMPESKKSVLLLGKLYLRLFHGVTLTDSQCGFRAMSRKAAETIVIKEDQMEHASEILIEVFKKKLKYREVPVKIIYTEYSKKHTHHGKFHLWSGLKIVINLMFRKIARLLR